MADISIRRAIPGDEQVLAYIQTESWKAAFGSILSPEELVRCTNLEKAEQMYHSILRREGCNMAIAFVADQPHCIAAWGKNRCDLGDVVAQLFCKLWMQISSPTVSPKSQRFLPQAAMQ